MFSHVMVGSNDIARSKKFYDALFASMGGKPGMEDAKGRLIYVHDGGRFLVTPPIDGKAATHANGGTIGFKCSSADQVRDFHDVAVAHGGTSIEGPPGLRESSMGALHLSYVRYPDGNKLCGIHRPK